MKRNIKSAKKRFYAMGQSIAARIPDQSPHYYGVLMRLLPTSYSMPVVDYNLWVAFAMGCTEQYRKV